MLNVEVVRGYGKLLRLVLQRGFLLRSLKVPSVPHRVLCTRTPRTSSGCAATSLAPHPATRPTPTQRAVARLQREAGSAPQVDASLEQAVEKASEALETVTQRIQARC